jgi:hypothetical protein
MPLFPRHFSQHFMQQQIWLSCANGAVACCSHSSSSTSTSSWQQIQVYTVITILKKNKFEKNL